MKNKVVIIIQARMASKRLPKKMLLKIGDNYLIDYIVRRSQQSVLSDGIVVATTDTVSDDLFADELRSKNINIFRASEKNVLERYYLAAKKYSADIIVRITGDNPVFDYELVDKLITFLKDNNYDYVSANNFPIGLSSEVFRMDTLEKVYSDATQSYEKEHVTPYIYENPDLFKINYLYNKEKYNTDMRLTIDTLSDYELIKKVYEYFNYNILIKSSEAVNYLNNNPDLLSINKNIKQKSYKETEGG